MKILITGAAGFIGSNLANYLSEKKHKIIAIDNLSSGLRSQVPKNKNIKFYKMDINDKKIKNYFKNIDIVFHLAAFSSVIECQQNPDKVILNNIEGSNNVFQLSVKNNVKVLIYAETSALYEATKKYPSKEEHIIPRTIYAWSKLVNHWQAKFYSVNSKTKFVGLRYLNVYGVNQDIRRDFPPVMANFINMILNKKRPYINGDGTKLRDFIYVDDVNKFHETLMKSKLKKHQVFNVGTGKNYSINQIYSIIAKKLNFKKKPIYKKNIDYEAKENLASTKLMKRIYKKNLTSIEDGLSRYIDIFKNKLKK